LLDPILGSRGLIEQLLNANFEQVGNPQLLIPWMVLQELDGLMKGPRKGVAQICVRYIDELLSSKHQRVRGQKPTEVTLAQEKFIGSNEDDSILQCALLCCDKSPDSTVVRFSRAQHSSALLEQPQVFVNCLLIPIGLSYR